MATYLFASAQNDNRVRRFRIDQQTGRLSHVGDTTVPDGPAPMTVSHQGSVLYIGHRGQGGSDTTGGDGVERPEFALSSWVIDPRTGDLSQTGRVHVIGEPCYISTDRRGRFLLSAYYQAGGCAVHPIDASGAVGGAAVEWRKTNAGAHSFQVDRSNRFGFVPHIADGSGGLKRLAAGPATGLNAIAQFRFNEQTGTITPNDPPLVSPGDPIGPRHHCFHPAKNLVYVDNEQGSAVTTYALDPDRGTLTELQRVKTLPADYQGHNGPAQIHLDAGGRFLYCSNRGHDTIASFLIDRETGLLTSTGWTKVGERPRAFGIEPSGNFLYATSQAKGTMTALRIDQSSGTLSPIEDYEVGAIPMWVSFAVLPDA